MSRNWSVKVDVFDIRAEMKSFPPSSSQFRAWCLFSSFPNKGQVAQLVEQWTENPCVAGSIPALTTLSSIASISLLAILPCFDIPGDLQSC
jgi:hypothetical protein